MAIQVHGGFAARRDYSRRGFRAASLFGKRLDGARRAGALDAGHGRPRIDHESPGRGNRAARAPRLRLRDS